MLASWTDLSNNCSKRGYLDEVTSADVDEDLLGVVKRAGHVEGRRERHKHLLPCTPTTGRKGLARARDAGKGTAIKGEDTHRGGGGIGPAARRRRCRGGWWLCGSCWGCRGGGWPPDPSAPWAPWAAPRSACPVRSVPRSPWLAPC